MSVLTDFLLSSLFGFLAHIILRPRTRELSTPGWQLLVSYAIGTVIVGLCGTKIYHILPELQNSRRFFVSWFIAALGVGSGVSAGWLLKGD